MSDPGSAPVRWRNSIRLRIAAAVAAVAIAVTAGAGLLIERGSAVAARDRLREQAIDRVGVASSAFAVTGQLRFDASLDETWGPKPLRDAARPSSVVTYFDGDAMWARERLSAGPNITVRLDAGPLNAERRDQQRRIVLAVVMAAIVASAAAWVIAGRLSSRLRRAAVEARAIRDGEESTMTVSGSDEVTELTRAVDQLAVAQARRLQQERAFTADVAHELRTPVTGLVSATELLDPGDAADLVRRQVVRLRRLVEDLLEVSRLESGVEKVTLEPRDLGTAVRAAVDAMLLDDREPPTVVVESSETVDVDQRRLDRIISNLVNNARTHGAVAADGSRKPAEISVVVSGATVTVSDTGPGYPESFLEDGPRRFRKGDGSAGTGLGLTIASRATELLGATLAFANAESGGAVATLRFHPAGSR